MQFLKSRTSRLAGLLTATAMLVGALVVGVGGAAADTFAFPLLPVAGANSNGSGAIAVTPIVGATQVQIDLSGARIGNIYNLSVCTNTGVSFSCTSAGTITTDATGSFHGFVLVGATTQIDLVALVNTFDPSDAYQAVTGTTPVSTAPVRAVVPSYPDPYGIGGGFPGSGSSFFIVATGTLPAGAQTTADGSILLPATSTTTMSFACPVGYSGPLLMTNPLNANDTFLIYC